MFIKLLNRNVPVVLLKVLINWGVINVLFVRWNSVLLRCFVWCVVWDKMECKSAFRLCTADGNSSFASNIWIILREHLFDDAVRHLCKLVAHWPCPVCGIGSELTRASEGVRMVGSHTKPIISHSSRWPMKIYGRRIKPVDCISGREHIVAAIVNESQYARLDEKDEWSCLMLRPS